MLVITPSNQAARTAASPGTSRAHSQSTAHRATMPIWAAVTVIKPRRAPRVHFHHLDVHAEAQRAHQGERIAGSPAAAVPAQGGQARDRHDQGKRRCAVRAGVPASTPSSGTTSTFRPQIKALRFELVSARPSTWKMKQKNSNAAQDGARAQVAALGAPQEGRQDHGRQREAHEDDPHRREVAGEVFHGGEGRAPDQGDEQQGDDAVEVAVHG